MPKINIPTAICLLLAVRLAVAEEFPMRTWRSRSGTTIEASYVELDRGGSAILQRADGRRIRIHPSDLHPQDRKYLAGQVKAEEEAKRKRHQDVLAGMGRKKPASDPNDDATPGYLSKMEFNIIKELNLARGDPSSYAEFAREYRKRHQGNGIFATDRGRVQSQEGLTAVDEAIAFLENAKTLRPLKPSEGLSLAADDHAMDTGPKGIVGHSGADGSTTVERVTRRGRWKERVGENISYGPVDARKIVLQLIIDDGVKNRGHRTNIFTGAFRVVGIATGSHAKYGSMCVMDFAGGFDD